MTVLNLADVPYEVTLTNKGKYGRKVNICGANLFLPKGESVKVLAESSADVFSLLDQETENLKVYFEEVDDGVKYPKLTAPSFSVILNKTTGTAGEAFSTTGKMVFDRGFISPAYGTSGYRAGLPISYTVGDQVKTTSDLEVPIEITIDSLAEGNTVYQFKVNYSAGEQPKDSEGNNYGSALSAGVLTKSITITGVVPKADPSDFLLGSEAGENKPSSVVTANISSLASEEVEVQTNAILTLPDGTTVLQAKVPTATNRSDYPYVLLQDGIEVSEVWGWNELESKWQESNDTFTKGEPSVIEGKTYYKWTCSSVNSGNLVYRLVLA